MTSLTPSVFAHFLWCNQESLLTDPADISDFSKALTTSLLSLKAKSNSGEPDDPALLENLKFKYHYTFWSDVTKVQEAGVKTSDSWEARLKEYGNPVTDVSVCQSQSYFNIILPLYLRLEFL